MKKLFLIIALLIAFTAYSVELKTTTTKTVKTEIVQKDTLKKDTISKAEKAVVAVSELTKKIEQTDMPEAGSNWYNWLIYVASFLIPLLVQWLRNAIPTAKDWHWLGLFSRFGDLLFNLCKLVYKLGNLVPNRKKSGGTFAQKIFSAKREELKNHQN